MLKCTGQWCLVVSLMTLSLVSAMPSSITSSTTPTTSTTSRTNVSPIGETIKQLADQLMNLNATSHITFDTRTPPKFREQTRKDHTEIIEFGHPGHAEPVDDEALIMEEENKKMNFYKVDKATTDSGLSTWILLSGQASTNKPTKKPAVTLKNASVSNDDKIIKPIFKRKSTTPMPLTSAPSTKKPTTLVSTTLKATIATTTLTTEKPEKTTKLTKVKASLINGNKTTASPLKKATARSTTPKPSKTTSKIEASSTTSLSPTKKSEFVKVPTKSSNSTDLHPEAKEGTLDLSVPPADNKKTKRPLGTSVATSSSKKKKNKNRRKKPIAEDKSDIVNGTKLATKSKEKPIGTQLYNYLSREVMPTVGVGLVGLMVTAGLASYFLYPFGPLRRSYNIDRKDKEGSYHYTDEYSGGIAEEEAIGKVIAGMPSNNYFNSNTRSQNSRNTYGLNEYNTNANGINANGNLINNGNGNGMNNNGGGYQPNSRFRNVEQRFMEGSVETVALNPMTSYRTEEVIIGSPKKNTYSNHKDAYEVDSNQESIIKDQDPNQNDHDQFVVGNVPQDVQVQVQATTEVVGGTPAVVPEHGPRTIEQFQDSIKDQTDTNEQERVFVVESVPAHAEALYAIEHGPRRRRRRQVRKVDKIDKEIDNEIDTSDKKDVFKETVASPSTVSTLTSDTTNESVYVTETTTITDEYYTSMNPIIEKTESILGLIKDLFYLKLRFGLQMLQDKAESLSRYFQNVQERIDVTYKNVNQTISYS